MNRSAAGSGALQRTGTFGAEGGGEGNPVEAAPNALLK
jgi:hypothetical protein